MLVVFCKLTHLTSFQILLDFHSIKARLPPPSIYSLTTPEYVGQPTGGEGTEKSEKGPPPLQIDLEWHAPTHRDK